MTEDEMVGWHHLFDEHEFEQAPGVGDGQGSLACCSPWGRKESDMTELNRYIHQLMDIWVSSTFGNYGEYCYYLIASFEAQSFFNFDEVQFTFSFISYVLVSYLRMHCLIQDHEDLLVCFLLRVV